MLFSLLLPLSTNIASATNSIQIEENNTIDTTTSTQNQSITAQTETYQAAAETKTIPAVGETKTAMAAGETTTITQETSLTVNSDQLYDATQRVKTFIDDNGRLPNYVTISGQPITMPQYLLLVSQGFLNINDGVSNSLSIEDVSQPTKPTESLSSGNIQKNEYVKLAENLISFKDANGRLPNYVTSSLGKMGFESMIYMYSKIVYFHDINGRLPNYVGVTGWSGQSNGTDTTTDPSLQKYLVATRNCQSDSSTIKSLSSSITSGISTTYSKAQAIFNWVRDNLSYSFYYDTKKGALGALSSRTANCCDHSHLVIALARAAGIPGRYIHVYGHVYSQLYVNGVWYNADAINNSNYFGQAKSSSNIMGTYAELPF